MIKEYLAKAPQSHVDAKKNVSVVVNACAIHGHG
jgi:hypothetical protein